MFDGMGISRLHPLQPHQRANQHEQRRFGQVEVGHQPVDGAESVARGDEDARIARKRLNDMRFIRRAFEQAQAGGADRNDPATGCARRIQPRGGFRLDSACMA